MEDEDFLSAIEADNIDAPVEDQPELVAKVETPEPVQPAPAETALVEPAAPTEPAVPTEPKEVQHAPLAALLDERDKRKAAETERDELRKQLKPAEPVQIPDVYEQPEEYAAYQTQQSHQLVLNARLDLSEDMAREKHGDDLVNAVQQWAQQRFTANPAFQAEVLGQRNPYSYAIREYQRDQIASQVSPDDFQQFQAWKAAQAGLTSAAPAAPATPASPIPPRSLASAPAAGGILSDVVQDDADIFDEVMSKG